MCWWCIFYVLKLRLWVLISKTVLDNDNGGRNGPERVVIIPPLLRLTCGGRSEGRNHPEMIVIMLLLLLLIKTDNGDVVWSSLTTAVQLEMWQWLIMRRLWMFAVALVTTSHASGTLFRRLPDALTVTTPSRPGYRRICLTLSDVEERSIMDPCHWFWILLCRCWFVDCCLRTGWR